MNPAFPTLNRPQLALAFIAAPVRSALRRSCLLWALLALFHVTGIAVDAVPPLADDATCTAEDRKFMARAYELAAIAAANGNGAYGALVVKDGKILMEFSNNARTSGNVTHHAETGLVSLTSVRLGLDSMAGCTFYTSTEPCIMCCGAIRGSKITRLVYGTTAIQVSRLRGRKPPETPLQVREVFERAGTTPVAIAGPLMEQEGLAVHAAALARLETKP
jgi:tRNA(Arg) A34 adenosine deaminase TadA